jgi:hypothetical protein
MSRHRHIPARWELMVPPRVWFTLADGTLHGMRLLVRTRIRAPRLLGFGMVLTARFSRAGVASWRHRITRKG